MNTNIGKEIGMEFKNTVLMSHPIGSRYVCNPPVMDTDKDTLCLVDDLPKAEQILLEDGWSACLKGEYIDTYFKAFRKGEDNYVITAVKPFFERYVIAAQVAKALNVQDKETRIKIHSACVEASRGFIGLIDWRPMTIEI